MEHASITADDVRFLSALAHAGAASRIASMNTAVDYVEVATGRPRTVTLVHPADADAGAGRVSVLSPVGRSLLGCCAGDHAEVRLPGGQPLRLRVVDVRSGARDG